MTMPAMSRRTFIGTSAATVALTTAAHAQQTPPAAAPVPSEGAQRLSLDALQRWESLGYGMFIHYGMSTYVQNELPDGKAPATTYAPDALDVDQWVQVVRDAGMKYAVLTTKHVAGHCLWPTEFTDYSVTNSSDKTDVVEAFVKACAKHGVAPGFYYCSWDNHNKFGSATPSDTAWGEAFTTSIYQTFQTNQITELIKRYGPIAEMWVDIPGVLGRGYRTYLYNHIASLQPDIVIMMNSGISTGAAYNVDYAWPSDLIAIERNVPPDTGHEKMREIEGKRYYIPGEVCDPIGKDWFYVEGDTPRADDALLQQYQACKARGVNLLLDVPPDKHGTIPQMHVDALMKLSKHVKG